jgi:very-short-patch-repair endonuclease
VRELLVRQHGVATAAQLAELGMAPSALTHRVQKGELERVLPRVYRSPLVPPSVAQSAVGAVLWAGSGTVASHLTAAALWGIDGLDAGGRVEIWVPGGRAPRNPRVVVHRGAVTGNDRRLRDRVPVTSPARTIVDLAAGLDREMLEAALEDVLHRGLTTASAIDRRLVALGGSGRVGAARLRRLLTERDQAPLESRLEVKVWRLLRGAGLRPVRQFEVQCEGRRYRLDFAWPRLKVAVEADGFRAHGGRATHAADRRRLAALVAAGWIVVPVTWGDCTTHPEQFIERVRAALLRAV